MSRRVLRTLFLAAACAAFLLAAPTPGVADTDSGVGVLADVGVPDGFIGAVTVRANEHIEFHAGGGHNSVSPGLRAGVQVSALTAALSPYAAIEAGYYFSGKATPWVQNLAAHAGLGDLELDRVGYSYGNAHLGVRLGGKTTAFYIQGGMSMVQMNVTVRAEDIPIEDIPIMSTTIDGAMNVETTRRWTPSGRVGLVSYF